MARADIDGAAERIKSIYESDFGGKRRGRFNLTRDQLATLLAVASVHDTAIVRLTEALLDDYDLVFMQRHHGRFGVVAGRLVGSWRKATKATIDDHRPASVKRLADSEADETDDE